MENTITDINKKDFGSLASEITYRRYSIEKINLTKLFQDISSGDYVALWVIRKLGEKDGGKEKIYLQEIAADLKLPMPRVSEMAQRLRDRGLLIWTHDGDGSDGTYVKLTESGKNVMEKQQEILGKYYKKVIERFGEEDFVQMLKMLARLEKIMDEEAQDLDKNERS